jgi:hypothetical protein
MPENTETRIERLERLAVITLESIQELREVQKQHAITLEKTNGRVSALEVAMKEMAEAQKHTDESLGTLIKMMDEWIRRNPVQGGAA